MKTILVIPLLVLSSAIAVYSIVCTASTCSTISCDSAPKSKDDCKSPAVFQKNATFCGCCAACITMLGEHARCIKLRGGPPSTAVCKNPLQCINGVCTRVTSTC